MYIYIYIYYIQYMYIRISVYPSISQQTWGPKHLCLVLSLVLHPEDDPLVWISPGFEEYTGYQHEWAWPPSTVSASSLIDVCWCWLTSEGWENTWISYDILDGWNSLTFINSHMHPWHHALMGITIGTTVPEEHPSSISSISIIKTVLRIIIIS